MLSQLMGANPWPSYLGMPAGHGSSPSILNTDRSFAAITTSGKVPRRQLGGATGEAVEAAAASAS
eukprot:CAMPEP_0173431858 /NCGR_PEP_ID=MMETSP1357-20121228/9864_1 /TAXON_ID=77926 /ORGANISM="Hemiselmis rufescens, Strain PCC563" /LENGTH=64 /DNA_ID=CAMNT_0014396383 /DNA_START=39 /DNA_END=234 /DNA_ORIENTATION=+